MSDAYPQARFISEHGYITLPSYLELQSYYTPVDYDINSNVSINRLKQPNGYIQAIFP